MATLPKNCRIWIVTCINARCAINSCDACPFDKFKCWEMKRSIISNETVFMFTYDQCEWIRYAIHNICNVTRCSSCELYCVRDCREYFALPYPASIQCKLISKLLYGDIKINHMLGVKP